MPCKVDEIVERLTMEELKALLQAVLDTLTVDDVLPVVEAWVRINDARLAGEERK